MGYEIRVVSNEEFDALPYKKVKSSLGLADPKTNIAYVRETGVRELDQSTIDHEFDELISKISPHEEDGIRYKSGGSLGQILAPVLGLALAPFTGGATIPLLAGGLLGAGTQYHTQSKKPEKYGKPSFGSIAGAAGTGALGAFGGSQIGSGIAAGVNAAKDAGTSQLMGGLKGAIGLGGGGAGSTPAGYSGSVTVPGVGSNIPMSSALTTASKAGTGLAGTGLAGAGTKLASTFGKTGTNLAKAGNVLNTFGGVTAPQETPSLYPQSRTPASNVGQFEESVAASPGALSRFLPLADPAKAITQEEFDLGRRDIALNQSTRLQNILDQFRSIRPGATPESDTALSRALGNVNRSSEAELEQLRKEASTSNVNVQNYNSIKQNNSLTDAQMKTYIELAKNGTDAQISAQVANKPEEFRSIFGNLKYIG